VPGSNPGEDTNEMATPDMFKSYGMATYRF
jgi:hypothetical protein